MGMREKREKRLEIGDWDFCFLICETRFARRGLPFAIRHSLHPRLHGIENRLAFGGGLFQGFELCAHGFDKSRILN